MALTPPQVLMHCADVFLAGTAPNHHSIDLASFAHNVRSVLLESGQAKLGGIEFSIINVVVEDVLTPFQQQLEKLDATTANAMGLTIELQILGDIVVKNVNTGSLVLVRRTPLMCVPNIDMMADPNTFVVNGTLRTIIVIVQIDDIIFLIYFQSMKRIQNVDEKFSTDHRTQRECALPAPSCCFFALVVSILP